MKILWSIFQVVFASSHTNQLMDGWKHPFQLKCQDSSESPERAHQTMSTVINQRNLCSGERFVLKGSQHWSGLCSTALILWSFSILFKFNKLKTQDLSLTGFTQGPNSYMNFLWLQMATALQFLRSIGIVHTDIKLDNIMLVDHKNQPLKVKMIDFGLARHVSYSQWGSQVQPLNYR